MSLHNTHLCVTNTIKAIGVWFPHVQKMCWTALPAALRDNSPGEAPEYSSSCYTSRKAEGLLVYLQNVLQTEVLALHVSSCPNGYEICTHLQFLLSYCLAYIFSVHMQSFVCKPCSCEAYGHWGGTISFLTHFFWGGYLNSI